MPVGVFEILTHCRRGNLFMLKAYLLSLGCFIDNEYLDEYLLFIEQPFSFSVTEYTEKHHVIPRSYYNSDYSKLSANEDISLNDPNNRLVKLAYADHFYAHWLLYNCTSGKLKLSNAKAVIAMSGKSDILDFPKDMILQIRDEIKRGLEFYWSAEDDSKLSELYLSGTPTEAISEILNKTTGAVKARICRLSLSDRTWTSEEETWLQLNYANLGKDGCAQHLNRTPGSIEHKVNRLQIATRIWTNEDTEWLILNYANTPTATCAEVLNRSISSITSKAFSLNLSKAIFWTETEDTWLRENKPNNTWQHCSDFLGRSICSIKQRAFDLKIPNDYHSKCSKSVRCVETGEIFVSTSQACKKYGQGVKHHLSGRHKSVKGLHFEYYHE